MRIELTAVPAIYLGDQCVVPQRKTWDIVASGEELEALNEAAAAIAACPGRFPLDGDQLRALAFAVETVQLLTRRERC